MRHELASCAARISKAKAVNDVVEPRLQQLEKRFTCDTALAQGALENAPELFFEKSVLIAQLLFFAERNCIIGLFAPGTSRAVLPGRIILSLQGLGRTKNRHTVAPTYSCFRSCVSAHGIRYSLKR